MRPSNLIPLVALTLLGFISCAQVLGIEEAKVDSSAATGVPGDCGITFTDSTCLQECSDNDCCSEASTCVDNADCAALVSCNADCNGDDACFASCDEKHPDGVPVLEEYFSCMLDCGCPSTDGTDSTDLESAITEYAQVDCEKTAECAPGALALSYGTVEGCVARVVPHNQWLAGLPGVAWDASSYADCSEATREASCADHINGQIPGCILPGALENGQSCDVGMQCASFVCENPDGTCGECVEAPSEGDDCIGGACGLGMTCADGGTCERPRALGEDCSGGVPCQGKMTCYEDVCSLPLAEEGAACDSAAGLYCDVWLRFVCAADTLTCVPVTEYLEGGENCGIHADAATMSSCARGTCYSETMKCVEYADDGAACDEEAGLYCAWPAYCWEGTCQLYREGDRCE